MGKVVTVYKFEYEKFSPKLGEKVDWITYIAGYGQEDAQAYLHLAVGKDITVKTVGSECRLDAISDEIRKAILDSAKPAKRKPGRPPKKKTT